MTAILTDGTFNRHLTFLYCYKVQSTTWPRFSSLKDSCKHYGQTAHSSVQPNRHCVRLQAISGFCLSHCMYINNDFEISFKFFHFEIQIYSYTVSQAYLENY